MLIWFDYQLLLELILAPRFSLLTNLDSFHTNYSGYSDLEHCNVFEKVGVYENLEKYIGEMKKVESKRLDGMDSKTKYGQSYHCKKTLLPLLPTRVV